MQLWSRTLYWIKKTISVEWKMWSFASRRHQTTRMSRPLSICWASCFPRHSAHESSFALVEMWTLRWAKPTMWCYGDSACCRGVLCLRRPAMRLMTVSLLRWMTSKGLAAAAADWVDRASPSAYYFHGRVTTFIAPYHDHRHHSDGRASTTLQ